MKVSKGITPVIAIVLLLLITVGAVGVVYAQFENIVGDPTQDIEDQERLRNADYSIVSIRKDESGDDSMKISIRNDAEYEWNLSKQATIMVGPDGNPANSLNSLQGTQWDLDIAGTNCYDPSNIGSDSDGVLKQSESYTCDTGVEWPQPTDGGTTIEIRLKDQTKDSSMCSPTTSSQTLC